MCQDLSWHQHIRPAILSQTNHVPFTNNVFPNFATHSVDTCQRCVCVTCLTCHEGQGRLRPQSLPPPSVRPSQCHQTCPAPTRLVSLVDVALVALLLLQLAPSSQPLAPGKRRGINQGWINPLHVSYFVKSLLPDLRTWHELRQLLFYVVSVYWFIESNILIHSCK